MNDKLKKLYQTVILKHNNAPLHFEKKEEASIVLEAYNQICGDRFKLFFELDNDKITDLSFHGFGCAISKASSSILVKHLEGKSVKEAKALLDVFFKVIKPDTEIENGTPDDFLAFEAAKEFPGRSKCATLSWDSFNDYLEKI